MKKIILFLSGLFILTNSFSQNTKRVMLFLAPEVSPTLSDRTKANNLTGIGLGFQLTVNTKTKFSPTINITDDFAFLDDKVFRTNSDGTEMLSLENVLKLFVGTNFNFTEAFYISLLAGPSFINGETLAGIKPSIGFYLPKTKRLTATVGYTTIFNRNSGQKENYTSLNFSIGLRLN